MSEQQKLFAFWKYDGWPTNQCLGGTITHMRPDGLIESENYGKGSYFKPFLILPEKQGKERMQLLKQLDADYRYEWDILKKKYAARHADLITIP